ncbi:hypothetical protein [Salinibacter ruber]|uniref:hypothetical protein n=1 Tax=Salinibacter ruber TaxID=146919 RepID=UPI001F073EFB|nr:hypothetical protein [Salinibacter ruber]
MFDFIDRIPKLIDRQVPGRGRLLLVVGAALLGASIFLPLWQIHLVAPQYQEGLDLYIHSYKLEAGNEGQDLKEINGLRSCLADQVIRGTINRIIAARTIASDISGRRS